MRWQQPYEQRRAHASDDKKQSKGGKSTFAQSLSFPLDDLGSVLGHTVDGSLNVSSDVERDDGSVNNTQVLCTVDDQARVDDTTFVARQHGRSSNGVVLGHRGGLGVLLLVDISTRPVLADYHV